MCPETHMFGWVQLDFQGSSERYLLLCVHSLLHRNTSRPALGVAEHTECPAGTVCDCFAATNTATGQYVDQTGCWYTGSYCWCRSGSLWQCASETVAHLYILPHVHHEGSAEDPLLALYYYSCSGATSVTLHPSCGSLLFCCIGTTAPTLHTACVPSVLPTDTTILA